MQRHNSLLTVQKSAAEEKEKAVKLCGEAVAEVGSAERRGHSSAHAQLRRSAAPTAQRKTAMAKTYLLSAIRGLQRVVDVEVHAQLFVSCPLSVLFVPAGHCPRLHSRRPAGGQRQPRCVQMICTGRSRCALRGVSQPPLPLARRRLRVCASQAAR